MHRRDFLAAVSTTVIGLSGCSTRTRPSATPTATASTSPTSVSAYGCPPYNPKADSVVCSHTVATETAPVYLLTSQPTAAVSETLELTLHNDSTTDLTFNPYSWRIMLKQGSTWERLEQRIAGNASLTVSPGETHTWTLAEAVDAINEQATLSPGTYTAEISVPDPDGSDWTKCVALFRLVAKQ